MAMAVGPIIGGFLTTYFSWRWAFRLEVAVLLGVFLMSRSIPKDVMGAVKPVLDKIGVIWQAAAMVLFVLGTLLIADYGLILAKQPLVIAGYEFAPLGLSIVPFLYGAALVCLIQFVHWEQHLDETGRERLIDLVLFGIGDFVQGLDVRFIQVALVAGTTFAVPLYLQVTYGISVFETGFILLGLTAGLLVTAMTGSKGPHHPTEEEGRTGVPDCHCRGADHDRVTVRRRGPRGPDARPVCIRPGNRPGGLADREPDHVGGDARAGCGGVGDRVDRGDPGERGGTAVIGTILVVALTSGEVMMVEQSSVFPCQVKQQFSQDMATSLEVVSTDVVSENIKGNGLYEAEAVRIYDTARQNAFIITLLSMAFAAFVAYLLARRLPAVKTIADAEA